MFASVMGDRVLVTCISFAKNLPVRGAKKLEQWAMAQWAKKASGPLPQLSCPRQHDDNVVVGGTMWSEEAFARANVYATGALSEEWKSLK